MAFDAASKMLLVRVVEEESPPGAIPEDMFIYKTDEKYQGDVQYKVVKPDTTTVYIVPTSIKIIYQYLNGWIPITVSFVFTWAITAMLLHQVPSAKNRQDARYVVSLTYNPISTLYDRKIHRVVYST